MSKSVHSVRFNGYKSFRDETVSEIDMVPYVSVFIGKNNCGKSTCFDVLQSVFEPEYFIKNNRFFSQVSVSFSLDEDTIEYGFSKGTWGGRIPGGSHYNYGIKFIGEKLYADLGINYGYSSGGQLSLVLSEYCNAVVTEEAKQQWRDVIRRLGDYDKQYEFRRINADRDIVPEIESANDMLEYDGVGATNIVRKFIVIWRVQNES